VGLRDIQQKTSHQSPVTGHWSRFTIHDSRFTAHFWLFFCFLVVSIQTPAQSDYTAGYFRSPVDFSLSLSGSFGEIRPDHFHSGIDIRTGGQIGKPVYAVADGYVSRIFVSPWGFGKAVYINHPSGHTTVYGHLHRFGGEIATYTRNQQYKRESFSMDVTVPTGQIQVRKGEVIGYSGNSGSSGGPHLHFEIRDMRTQEPMDPLAFGIPVKDNIRPKIRWVKIYPYDEYSIVNFVNQPLMTKAVGGGGSYGISLKDTIMVSGNIIFGIEAYDYHDNSSIRCGIKSIDLFVDDEKVFGQQIDRYAFKDTRYVNAILDYPQNKKNKQRIQRSYVSSGNWLDVFHDVVNNGIIGFYDLDLHKIRYIIKDVHGNTSKLTFWVKSHPPAPGGTKPRETSEPQNIFSWDIPNSFENSNIRLKMPAMALYEDIDFGYRSSLPVNGSYARVHELHDEGTPIHFRCTLSIRAETLPRWLESKALIVKVGKNNKFTSKGGSFKDGFVTIRIREFGKYTISVDTIAPTIKPVNIYNSKNISKQQTITLTISDEFSGIKRYRGTLNGRWILMDFDAKRKRLVYKYDERIKTGSNKFHLVVTDGVGNKTEYKATLIR